MILVDTSVWVDHLRSSDEELGDALLAGEVLVHPWILGELALGGMPADGPVAEALADLPEAPVASTAEVLGLIARRGLTGRGIGYVDAHLIASVLLQPGTRLLTRDRRLREVAAEFAIAALGVAGAANRPQAKRKHLFLSVQDW